jgi:YbbR domain-containing protein
MKIRDLLLENWGLKLTSVFLASILWLMVHGDTNTERVLSVPLEIRVPRNMEISSERPSTVDVTVRGTSTTMWFAQTLPTYIIDLQTFSEGDHQVQLSPANVRLPRASGLEALSVRPARLTLVLEKTVSKEIPIRVTSRGEPEPGYDIYGITVSPSTALLTGPRTRVEKIKETSTEAVSIAGRRESLHVYANLNISDNSVHIKPTGPVEITIQLGPHRRMQRVSGITVQPDAPGFACIPRTVAVQVLVPANSEKNLAPSDFLATVAASSMEFGAAGAKAQVDVRLKNPTDPAIMMKGIIPAEVLVQRAVKKGS